MVSAGFPPEAPCLPGRNHPEFRRHRLRGGWDGGSRPFAHRAEADGCHPGSDPGGEGGVVEVDQRGTEPDSIRVAGWIRGVFGERLRVGSGSGICVGAGRASSHPDIPGGVSGDIEKKRGGV